MTIVSVSVVWLLVEYDKDNFNLKHYSRVFSAVNKSCTYPDAKQNFCFTLREFYYCLDLAIPEKALIIKIGRQGSLGRISYNWSP